MDRKKPADLKACAVCYESQSFFPNS